MEKPTLPCLIGWGCSPHLLQNSLPFFYGEDYTQISFLQSFMKINEPLGIAVLLWIFCAMVASKMTIFCQKMQRKKFLTAVSFVKHQQLCKVERTCCNNSAYMYRNHELVVFLAFILARDTSSVTFCNLKEMYSSSVHLTFLVFVDKYSRCMILMWNAYFTCLENTMTAYFNYCHWLVVPSWLQTIQHCH